MELKTDLQKTCYALGLNMGMQVSQMPIECDKDAFLMGFLDMMENNAPKITQKEFTDLLTKLFDDIEKTHKHSCDCGCEDGCDGGCGGHCHADPEKTKADGAAYREEHARKEGVVVTPSGLQILHTVQGTGRRPAATDTVKVHYTGRLIDGTVFDSSVERGEPIEFPLNRVIAGWTEGLQLMAEGGKATLVIPPELGYGEQGAGHAIPPHATLVFDVELLNVL